MIETLSYPNENTRSNTLKHKHSHENSRTLYILVRFAKKKRDTIQVAPFNVTYSRSAYFDTVASNMIWGAAADRESNHITYIPEVNYVDSNSANQPHMKHTSEFTHTHTQQVCVC